MSGCVLGFTTKLGSELCKAFAVAGLVLYIVYILISKQSSELLSSFILKQHGMLCSDSNTKISDIVFGIATSAHTWKAKRPYIDAWWKPNITRGFVWFDRDPKEYFPWPANSPPFRISEDIQRFKEYNKHPMPYAIRMARVILETFREDNTNVKWYVMADDDTVLIVDNIVKVLSKYDHSKYWYIGVNSECVTSNYENSFRMAFGGAGYALSYPLAKALSNSLDECIKRYPTLYGSDYILQSCISDLGVMLTYETGFHQIDLHADLSGYLSAHPQAPFLSLHHLDHVDPIFPSMNRHEALYHLMKAAEFDSLRLLQQTICHDKPNNWSFSISFGYSAQIYEKIHPPSYLEKPLQTFTPWRSSSKFLHFMFNTRIPNGDPCQAPHFFFFDSIEQDQKTTQTVTNYIRKSPRKLPTCLSSGSHSADTILKVRVSSPAKKLNNDGRRECCDVIGISSGNVTEIRIRECMKNEIAINL